MGMRGQVWNRHARGWGSRVALLTALGVVGTLGSNARAKVAQAPGAGGSTPVGWLVFTDTSHRFEVAYPPEFAIIPEKSEATGVVKRVRFQDKQLLATPFGELEPARLTIEVFSATTTSLGEWLRSTGRLPAGATVTRRSLTGANEGARVQLRQQLAPNDFYYFSTDSFVYRLAPLGLHSSEMLASFRVF
jgi:hypothetical protein